MFPMNSFPTIWLEFNQVRGRDQLYRLSPTQQAFYLRTEAESYLYNVVLNKKAGRHIMSKKTIIAEFNYYKNFSLVILYVQICLICRTSIGLYTTKVRYTVYSKNMASHFSKIANILQGTASSFLNTTIPFFFSFRIHSSSTAPFLYLFRPILRRQQKQIKINNFAV